MAVPLDLPSASRYRRAMNCRFACWVLIFAFVVLLPFHSPAPLVYTPGEGWTYEPVGGEGKWQRTRAKDQLAVAQEAFDKRDYGLAIKAARRVVKVWPLSDYAPHAQYLVGRSYEAKKRDEKAFNSYQLILEKYPKADNVGEVLQRQYEIANRYLAGQWFKLWGYIPTPQWLNDGTVEMYEKIVKNGPYSDVAPQAQLRIGTAHEKHADYADAVKAYETAADRYNDRPQVAADALYHAGLAYKKQAATAEYDQNIAGQAISTFTDFITLYPDEPRVPEARKIIADLKSEQARGNFEVAKYYEKGKKWSGALVYYNEVLLSDPNSPLAASARQRIDAIKKQAQPASK